MKHITFLLVGLLFIPFVSSATTLTPSQRLTIEQEIQVLEAELAQLVPTNTLLHNKQVACQGQVQAYVTQMNDLKAQTASEINLLQKKDVFNSFAPQQKAELTAQMDTELAQLQAQMQQQELVCQAL